MPEWLKYVQRPLSQFHGEEAGRDLYSLLAGVLEEGTRVWSAIVEKRSRSGGADMNQSDWVICDKLPVTQMGCREEFPGLLETITSKACNTARMEMICREDKM